LEWGATAVVQVSSAWPNQAEDYELKEVIGVGATAVVQVSSAWPNQAEDYELKEVIGVGATAVVQVKIVIETNFCLRLINCCFCCNTWYRNL
jgi:hypothetical protein